MFVRDQDGSVALAEKSALADFAALAAGLEGKDEEAALAVFCEFAQRVFSSRVLLAWREGGGVAAKDLSSGVVRRFELHSSMGRALEGKTVVDNRLGRYGEWHDSRIFFEEGARALFAAPAGDRALVLLSNREGAFSPEKAGLAALAARLLALALERARLLEENRRAGVLLAAAVSGMGPALFLDSECGIVAASASASALFKARSLVGQSALPLLQDERARAALAAALRGGEELAVVTRLAAGDAPLTALLSLKHPPDTGISLLCIEDLTGEAAAAASAAEVARGSPDTLLALDERGRIAFLAGNTAPLAAAGELIGQSFSSLVFPADYNTWADAVKEARERGRALVAVRLICGSEPRFFELALSPRRAGGGFYGVLRDAGERRGGSAEELAARLIARSSDAIYAFDAYGVLRSWNKAAERVLGYSEREALGRDVRSLYPPERAGELDSRIRALAGGGEAAQLETQRLAKGGGRAFVYSTLLPVVEGGRTTGYVEILRDVTALKKMEELERARKRLEESNRRLFERAEAQSAFISNVSHELRTPLTSIHGYASLLLDGTLGPLSSAQREGVAVIANESARLARLINEVLDLSKMDSGRFKLSPKEFDVRELEEKCRALLPLAEKKGLWVRWEIAADAGVVTADPARIAQVLINLVSNAIKFTEKGGVSVKIFRKSRRTLQFEVIDTGIGIPAEERKNIFKRFYQVKREAGKIEGTGLGLSIAREIVRLHGGRLDFESEVGKGSRFYFTLPVAPKKKREKSLTPSSAPASSSSSSAGAASPSQPASSSPAPSSAQPVAPASSDAEPEQPPG